MNPESFAKIQFTNAEVLDSTISLNKKPTVVNVKGEIIADFMESSTEEEEVPFAAHYRWRQAQINAGRGKRSMAEAT